MSCLRGSQKVEAEGNESWVAAELISKRNKNEIDNGNNDENFLCMSLLINNCIKLEIVLYNWKQKLEVTAWPSKYEVLF